MGWLVGVVGEGGAVQRRVVLRAGELEQRLRPADLEAVVVVSRGRGVGGGDMVQVVGGHRDTAEWFLRGRPGPLAQDGLHVQFAVFAGVCTTAGNRPYSAAACSEEKYS